MSRRFGRGLDDAFDRVDEVHRRVSRRHLGRHQPPMFFGFVLVGLGVLFLLDNLNVIETRDTIRTFWPTVIIGWGVIRLVRARGGERLLGAVAVFVGSLFLGNQLFDLDISVMAILWPLILIAFGISILSRSWGASSTVHVSATVSAPAGAAGATEAGGTTTTDADPDARVDSSSTIREFAVMAGVERKNISQTFRGGDVTAAMGSVEIDLRECRMAAEDVQVSVSVFLGEVVFRIPRDWTVDSRVAVVMASFEDRSEAPVGASPKRLVISGSAFLGNVEIRN